MTDEPRRRLRAKPGAETGPEFRARMEREAQERAAARPPRRAKPSALPDLRSGVYRTPPDSNVADLELRTAERDGALIALQSLERILTRNGGFMTPMEQDSLAQARAVLAQHGRYVGESFPGVWVDRKPCAGCKAMLKLGPTTQDAERYERGLCGACEELRVDRGSSL